MYLIIQVSLVINGINVPSFLTANLEFADKKVSEKRETPVLSLYLSSIPIEVTLILIKWFFFSAAVVLVFFVCWTPFHAQRLMFVIVTLQGSWTTTNGFAHHVLFLASGSLHALIFMTFFKSIIMTSSWDFLRVVTSFFWYSGRRFIGSLWASIEVITISDWLN